MPSSRKPRTQLPHVTEIDDENVICPICQALVLDIEGCDGPDYCEHVVCCYPWDCEDFDKASDAVRSWWAQRQSEAEAKDESVDPRDMKKCPHIQHLIVHSVNGMACGPVCSTASFGFSTVTTKAAPATAVGKFAPSTKSNKAKVKVKVKAKTAPSSKRKSLAKKR